MKYVIKIEYRTGNSFGSHKEESSVEGSWSDLEIAKENLNRIKEHYEYYCSLHDSYSRKPQSYFLDLTEKAKEKVWFDHDKRGYSTYFDSCLMLKLDNGTEYSYCAFWCGYFERLLVAEIVPEPGEDSDMRIEF